jgi:hypothetical protein
MPALLLTLVVCAACGPAGAPSSSPVPTPQPSQQPTPTPLAAPVSTPAGAAALVIATDSRFAGAIQLTPDIIGASKWWKAEPLAGGGYRIELTIGWGDCPSGCINRHVWTFDVDATGKVTLVGESGDEVPADLPG